MLCFRGKNSTITDKKSNEIIISIVGLDDSGKTAIVKVLKGEKDFEEIAPTVGYVPHDLKHNSRDLRLYDLGGGIRVRDIWKHYLTESHGFIYVIDASNRNRINECRNVFAKFVENDRVAGKPILILANKQDQPYSLDESEIVQFLNVEDLVNQFHVPCRIEPCSALNFSKNKEEVSIKMGFDWLIKHITHHYEELKTRIEFDLDVQKLHGSYFNKDKNDATKKGKRNDYDYDDDFINDKNSSMKLKDDKLSKALVPLDSKLSAYDRQLLDNMAIVPSKPRLTTINEDLEKSKLKNRFLKPNNKIGSNIYDEKSDSEVFSKSKISTSWAITDSLSARSRGLNHY